MLALLCENTTEYEIQKVKNSCSKLNLNAFFVNVSQCNNVVTC